MNDNLLELTIDNLIKSIDIYKNLIIITEDVNINLIYIDCAVKLDNSLKILLKNLEENKDKYPKEYLKYISYQRKSIIGVI
jgi:hypothetical protein